MGPYAESERHRVAPGEPSWIVSVDSREAEQGWGHAPFPVCGTPSSSRHSSYLRTLWDLSAQGTLVNIQARLTCWRCRNDQCDCWIFAERLPRLATPFARRTSQLVGIVRLFGHSAGGRPAKRLMARLGMPVSDTETVQNLGVNNWTGPFALIEAATTLNRVTSIRATATIPTSALSFRAAFVHPQVMHDLIHPCSTRSSPTPNANEQLKFLPSASSSHACVTSVTRRVAL